MSQISPPVRVLAIAAVAFLAAWMLFLRPKAETVPPVAPVATPAATTTPASVPGRAVETAQETARAAAAPGSGAAPVSPAALATLPKDAARAIERQKVLVLLFWNDESADDRAVRRELRTVDRWGGRVVVEAVPVGRISRYGAITRGANVGQSATVVVVDRNRKVETLVGYVDAQTIDQAVFDALRNSGTVIRDSYLRAVNATCTNVAFVAEPSQGDQVQAYFARWSRVTKRFDRRFMAVKAPGKWRAFRAASHADHVAIIGTAETMARAIARGDLAGYLVARGRYEKVVKRYDARMDEHHVLACGSSA